MILDAHFDRIVILSLPGCEDRAERALAELLGKNLSATAQVVRAIDGKLCPPSDWWPSGGGAWGCMQSHSRVVQDALMDGVERLLVIEDDAIWQNDAERMAREFLDEVPDDWGQIYFGGQHRSSRPPTPHGTSRRVMRAHSIHRTHCYAIHRRIMPAFLKHIIYAPDYIAAKEKEGVKRHVDHQLEIAHRRGDWPVYAPSFWLCGQGENKSTINGREWRRQFWHMQWRENFRRLPIILCDRAPTPQEMADLHFGKHLLADDPTIDEGVRDAPNDGALFEAFLKISSEALSHQMLPAMHDFGTKHEEWLRARWPGGVIRLTDAPDIAALCDLPRSRIIDHPWWQERLEETEPSESTEATAELEKRPCVHQVWIGDAELPPRLAAYCETIRKAFPGWNYKLWGDADLAELATGAVLPDVVRPESTHPVGLRSDVIRLEILRQHGGVYFDCDFEALRPDLRPLFGCESAFYYGDELSGRPAIGVLASLRPRHPFVEFYLRRIAANLRPMKDLWETVGISGPDRLAEALNLWVGKWDQHEALNAADDDPLSQMGLGPTACRVGNLYACGTIAGLWRETVYPYHFNDGTWATFDPAEHPLAWAAHHWEGSWHNAVA